jgi:hypothetical protein
MSSAARPNQTSDREPAVSGISQRVEFVAFEGQLPVSDAELDALEQLLGSDLHQLLQ